MLRSSAPSLPAFQLIFTLADIAAHCDHVALIMLLSQGMMMDVSRPPE